MRSIRSYRFGALLCAGLALAATSAAAKVMVLRATGPSAASFAPGKTMADQDRVTLKANDTLTVLDARGTRILRGPGSFVIGQASAASTSTLAALAGPADQRRARIGAVRGTPPPGGPQLQPNIWFIDAARSGTVCVSDPQAVTLWRSVADQAGGATIAADGGAAARVDWIAGQSTLAWPASLPITDNAVYRVTGAGIGPGGSRVQFRVVRSLPGDLQQLAAALIANQCEGQLDVLIRTTSDKQR